MKDVIPEPVHESYRRHRKQRTSQIILPMALVALLFIAIIVWVSIATANGGDVDRWAAISAMWISMLVCLTGFIFLAVLGGLIFLMAQLLGVAPVYTGKAQDFVHKLAIRIRRAADTTVKPVFAVNGFGATIKALLGRK